MEGTACETLEAEITELWGRISAATYRFLKLLARYDRERGWEQHGLANCAQWLNWQCGIGPVAAREKLRVAHALEALPKISAAFEHGQLSYSKVRGLTRVARPEIEDDLLNIARHGTAAHVERLVRRYRREQRLEAAREAFAQHEARSLSHWFDEDGSFVLHARLAPEVGALVKRALELAGEHTSAETFCARQADALAELADNYLASSSVDDAAQRRTNADRYQIVVHVEADTADSEIENGPQIAEETTRRIGCDSSLLVMTHDADGSPLNVGRRTRAISPAMRRALYTRDRGCRFPGCTHTRHCEGHHVRHWSDGGETKLPNLVTLCSLHHRLVHEGGFDVCCADDGAFIFTGPDGARIPESGMLRKCFRGNISSLTDAHVDSATIRPHWYGEIPDYGQAIDAINQRVTVGAQSVRKASSGASVAARHAGSTPAISPVTTAMPTARMT